MLRIFLPESEDVQNESVQERNDQTIIDLLLEENPNAVLIDSLDAALIGLQRCPKTLPIAAYDYWWSISILCDSDFNYWEAVEYIQDLPHGENDPVFIQLELSRGTFCINQSFLEVKSDFN
jgi:hypothetical protein